MNEARVYAFCFIAIALAPQLLSTHATERKEVVIRAAEQSRVAASPAETREPRFSDLTLFLLGSGFAIFVALLGWSDQIRGLAKETRELQSEFLRRHGLSRVELQPVLEAATPEEQLQCFTRLMPRLSSASGVRLLPLLRDWHRQAKFLEKIQSWKYYLTVGLSFAFFCTGGLAAFQVSEVWLILIPATLIFFLFCLILAANVAEQALHQTLNKMTEHL